ncbi:hypothetical protein ACH4FE_35735 [Streptomyces celluloflavus]|uniref:hypothetical protein n=1 Tax=Streptomyces celluloflavus TaxID=58344 RepID=UPI0037BBED4D
MNDTKQSPWNTPPERQKKLRQRKAERLARRAEYWGQRIEAAREIGPEAAASLVFDRARGDLDRLPSERREGAYEALMDAIEHVRVTHTQ